MKISLPSGEHVLVDGEDFEILNQFKWFLFESSGIKYARGYLKSKDKHKPLMHRVIMGVVREPSILIDHKNRNGLDNRRSNLRICTRAENQYNAIGRRESKHSRFKGVSKMPDTRNLSKPWIAQIQKEGKVFRLGNFATENQAAEAYNEKAKEIFGEFSRLNKVKLSQ
jgi:hypothetical protein